MVGQTLDDMLKHYVLWGQGVLHTFVKHQPVELLMHIKNQLNY